MPYVTSPAKRRKRRTRAEIEAENPMSVRQVFYQAVTHGIVAKTEMEYNKTVGRLLTEMRRAGDLPFEWIADSTRWMRKPTTHSSLRNMLERTKRTYRRALEIIEAEEKPAYLYYLGDHDPSGADIPRKVERDLRKFAPDAEIHFEPVAVTLGQIDSLNLPTRPTKTSDSRAKNFNGESVELDSIPPATLRSIVRECIEQHIDYDELDRLLVIEDQERDTLERVIGQLEAA